MTTAMARPILFTLLALVGCASPTTQPTGDLGVTDAGNNGMCVPGRTQSCICLGGGTGTQTCRETGTSYGSCASCSGDAGTLSITDGGGNPCGDCTGCCDGIACIAFGEQTNSQCGVAGTACSACNGQVCNTADGTCVSPGACGSTCSGCCGRLDGADHCFIDTPSACGSANGTCMACTSGTLCSSGKCNDAIDPAHQFKVTVETLQVYNTDGKAHCWANNGYGFGCGQPTLSVCFAYDPGSGLVAGCTTQKANVAVDNGKADTDDAATDSTSWSGSDGVIVSNGNALYIPGSAFLAGKVLVYVVNAHTVYSDDIVGSSYISADTYFDSGDLVGPWGRVVSVTFQVQ